MVCIQQIAYWLILPLHEAFSLPPDTQIYTSLIINIGTHLTDNVMDEFNIL